MVRRPTVAWASCPCARAVPNAEPGVPVPCYEYADPEDAPVNSSLELAVVSSSKEKPTVTKALTVAQVYQVSCENFPALLSKEAFRVLSSFAFNSAHSSGTT